MKNETIRRSVLSLILVALSGLWINTAHAQGVLTEETGDRWNSTLFGYAWASGLDGTAAVRGNSFAVDESFSDLIEDLDAALSLRFESHKGKWGYFLDGMYVRLDPSATTPAGTINTEVRDLMLEAGGVYHFSPTVQGLFGARYQDMEVDISLPMIGTVSGGQDWVDGFLGLRLVPVRSEKWQVWLRGDVGVVGDSDTIWNAVIGAAYKFNPRWSGVLAYRVMSTDFEEAGFGWDMKLSGLGLAVGYSF